MYISDLQNILATFADDKSGSSIRHAKIYVSLDPQHIAEIKKIDVQENNIIGSKDPLRVVLYPQKESPKLIIQNALVTLKPERKLYHDLKKNTPGITWNRIENLAGIGLPDVLGYNTSCHFFTVELKVIKGNRIRFSPHQISFHITHPTNTFILVRALGQRSLKLFHGAAMRELVALGYACDLQLAASWAAVLEALLEA